MEELRKEGPLGRLLLEVKERKIWFGQLVVDATVYEDFFASLKKEELEEWLGDIGTSLHITKIKNNLTDLEECKIYVTVTNYHNINSELKDSVNMKLQGW